MFRKAKPITKLDERLREIEREAERIQGNIKALNKAVDHSDPDTIARLAPRPPVEPQHIAAPQPDSPATDEAGYASNRSLPGPLAQTNANYFDRYSERKSDGRFARYLRATGLSSEQPLRAERAMQRNKAIFMVIIVLIVIFIVYKFFN